jgi:hypothetical protein
MHKRGIGTMCCDTTEAGEQHIHRQAYGWSAVVVFGQTLLVVLCIFQASLLMLFTVCAVSLLLCVCGW